LSGFEFISLFLRCLKKKYSGSFKKKKKINNFKKLKKVDKSHKKQIS